MPNWRAQECWRRGAALARLSVRAISRRRAAVIASVSCAPLPITFLPRHRLSVIHRMRPLPTSPVGATRRKRDMASTDLLSIKSGPPAPNAPRANIVSVLAFLFPAVIGGGISFLSQTLFGVIIGLLLGFLLAQSPKVAKEWERAVVLRL